MCMFVWPFFSIMHESIKSKFKLSRPDPVRREKINSNFCFHTSLWCLWRFSEGVKSLSSAFRPYFRTNRDCLTKLGSSASSFNTRILTPLYLKFKTSAHVQIAFIHYYILFTSFLTWYEFDTYNKDTFSYTKLVNNFINLNMWLFLKIYSGL